MKSLLATIFIYICSCQNIDEKEEVSIIKIESNENFMDTISSNKIKIDTTKNLTNIPYSIMDVKEFYQMELHNSQNNSRVKFKNLSTFNTQKLESYLDKIMEPKGFEGEIEKLYSDSVGDFLSIKLHQNFHFQILKTNEIELYINGESPFCFLYKNCKIRVGADLDLLETCGLNKARDIHTNKDYIGIYLSPNEQFITMYIDNQTNNITNIRLTTNI